MMLQKTPHPEGTRPPRRRAPSPSRRPYTHFERGGARRFGRATSLYRPFRVHG